MTRQTAELKDRLRSALIIRDMKPVVLSDKTGIPKSAISQYMSGYAKPKDDRIYKICQALKIQEAWLLGYDVPMDLNITYEEVLDNSPLNNAINKASNNEPLTLDEANLILKKLPKVLDEASRRLLMYHDSLSSLNAAHSIPGAADDDKKHDDEIMDDENF